MARSPRSTTTRRYGGGRGGLLARSLVFAGIMLAASATVTAAQAATSGPAGSGHGKSERAWGYSMPSSGAKGYAYSGGRSGAKWYGSTMCERGLTPVGGGVFMLRRSGSTSLRVHGFTPVGGGVFMLRRSGSTSLRALPDIHCTLPALPGRPVMCPDLPFPGHSVQKLVPGPAFVQPGGPMLVPGPKAVQPGGPMLVPGPAAVRPGQPASWSGQLATQWGGPALWPGPSPVRPDLRMIRPNPASVQPGGPEMWPGPSFVLPGVPVAVGCGFPFGPGPVRLPGFPVPGPGCGVIPAFVTGFECPLPLWN